MGKHWKNFFTICKILIISSIFFSIACNKQSEADSSEFDNKLPDEESENVVITATSNNNTEWILNAKKIKRFYDEKNVFGDSVFVKIFNEDNSITTIACDNAEVDDISNILTGKGNVTVVSSSGIMKTPYLIWDRNTDELFAKERVKLVRDDNTIYGKEMKSDIKLNRIELTEVSSEGTIDEKEFDW
jgi:LPS export ABC transporter protein LptC